MENAAASQSILRALGNWCKRESSTVVSVAATFVVAGIMVYTMRMTMPNRAVRREEEEGAARRARLLAKLKAAGRSDAQAAALARLQPNEFELAVLSDVVFPDEISAEFKDIGGHGSLKRALYESLILPLQQPELYKQIASSKLVAMPKGILFYGPPGTGKTMMGKAIAKASGATFINVRLSSLHSKWFGESQKMVRAVFSVAQQYAPSIIFVDECESFMRQRGNNGEHEASSTMRTEWLSLMDGLLSASSVGDQAAPNVMVLACSNRPWDIDEAFLRRMPRSFLLPLPSLNEREDILALQLRDAGLAPPVSRGDRSDRSAVASQAERATFLSMLAEQTAGYSGSDLKELVRVAAARPLRALIKQHTRKDFEQLMHGRGGDEAAAVDSPATAAAAAGAAAAASAAAATAAVSAASSPASIESAAVAAVSGSPSPSPAAPAPQAVRPLRLSDFKHALRAVRPTGQASMRELLLFEQKHRGSLDAAMQAHRSGAQDSEQDEEEEEEERDGADARGQPAPSAGSRAAAAPPSPRSFSDSADDDADLYV